MLMEGVRLMTVGMFTVFVFLTLLVGLMKASAAFFEANAHRFPEEEPAGRPKTSANTSRNTSRNTSSNASSDDEIAVAIALASAMRRGQRV